MKGIPLSSIPNQSMNKTKKWCSSILMNLEKVFHFLCLISVVKLFINFQILQKDKWMPSFIFLFKFSPKRSMPSQKSLSHWAKWHPIHPKKELKQAPKEPLFYSSVVLCGQLFRPTNYKYHEIVYLITPSILSLICKQSKYSKQLNQRDKTWLLVL